MPVCARSLAVPPTPPTTHTRYGWTKSNCPFASHSWEGWDSPSLYTHRKDTSTATLHCTHWYHPWDKNYRYLLLLNLFPWSEESCIHQL